MSKSASESTGFRAVSPQSLQPDQHHNDAADTLDDSTRWTLPLPQRSNDSPPIVPGDRPEILIGADEKLVNDQAVQSLTSDPNLYCRGSYLVSVRRDKRRTKLVNSPEESPWIASVPKAILQEKMSHAARWVKEQRNTKSDKIKIVLAHPPKWSVEAVAARGEWDGIRHLEGLVEAPALLADGSILDQPGYDERSGLLYEPSCHFPPIPESVSRDDARRAADELLEVVADFPFAVIGVGEGDGGAGHRAAWLAGLLTPLARHAIEGPCPLFLADANTAGAGKSKLCDIVAILATGRVAARTAFPDSDEEMRKQILSIAIAGDRLILIDNVASGASLGGAALDGVLTGTTVKGRILGKTEMSRDVPIHTNWYATGNNLGLKGDMLRRVVPYRLDSPEERPEERKDFRIKGDLLQYVMENRGRLVVAVLTILRGFMLTGKPQADLIPMDYPVWCSIVRQAIYWSTGIDPCSTRRELIADDPKTNQLRAVVSGWAELPRARTGLSAAEAVKMLNANGQEDRFGTLRSAVLEWSTDGKIPSPQSIGKNLKAIKGRVVDGLVMKSKPSHGTQLWSVVEVNRGGVSGDSGSVSIPFAGEIFHDLRDDLFSQTWGNTPTIPTNPPSDESTMEHGDAWENAT